jgi:hypothetical protein
MRFEGIRVVSLPFRRFREGAALTIPGVGLFVGKGWEKNTDLLRHEFGHILQYRKWGIWMFWKHIALDSLQSARKNISNKHHMSTWTEWSANRLAYDYFKQPADWNLKCFPIQPPPDNNVGKPKFAKNNEEFLKNWMDV